MVAQRASVSTATVSYVVNGSRRVSEELRVRVLEAITALDFTPNLMARGLRKQRSHTISLIMANIANPYYSELARFMEDAAYGRGYTIVFCNSDDSREKERTYLQSQIARRVDGIIIAPSSSTGDLADELGAPRTPCVLINRKVPGVSELGLPSFTIDNDKAAYRATRHLIEHGHMRIAAITGAGDALTTSGRLMGYERAMADLDLATENLIRSGESSIEGARSAMSMLLEQPERPTAVVVMGTTMTLGVLQALREAKLDCPGELALVSFSETTWSALTSVPLTTVRQPIEDIARRAVHRLLDYIEGHIDDSTFSEEVIFESELVIRRSCGCDESHALDG